MARRLAFFPPRAVIAVPHRFKSVSGPKRRRGYIRRTLDQQRPHFTVPCFADPKLLVRLARIDVARGTRPEERTDVARPTKAMGIANGEDELQRGDRTRRRGLGGAERFRDIASWAMCSTTRSYTLIWALNVAIISRSGPKARLQVGGDPGRRFPRESTRVTGRQADPDGLDDAAHRVDRSRARVRTRRARARSRAISG